MRERIGEVILHLSLNKTPLKNGKHAAYIRVQHKAQNRYFSCHSEFTEKEWEKFEKCPEDGHPVMIAFKTFKEAVKTLIREEDFSFTNLSQMTRRSRSNTIQELIKIRAEELSAEKKHSTSEMYNNLCVRLNEFLDGRPTPVGQMTEERCRKFLAWLSNEKGNGPTAISIKAKNLTAILNKAVKDHLIPKNPMEGIKKPAPRRRVLFVSNESLQKLLKADRSTIGDEIYWLSFWKAIYFGNGMNVTDLLRLRRQDINYSVPELTFIRHKTAESSGADIHVPLTPEFVTALETISGGKEHIIPILDGYQEGSLEEHKRIKQTVKNINVHLKRITEMLKIKEKITTYTGRHCFATVLQQHNVSVEFISAALGHRSIKTTQNYLDGYTSQQRRTTAKLLNVQ